MKDKQKRMEKWCNQRQIKFLKACEIKIFVFIELNKKKQP